MIDIDKIVKIVDQDSPNYPLGLLSLPNYPKRIFALGNESLLKNMCVAIVGTRACSDYGRYIANTYSKEISKYNITVISGMAVGIDESAHQGSYEYGSTIAVVAGGFKEILKGNRLKIAEDIISHNGLIISEYHPDFIVRKGMFLQRNRLIAAIASAIIVVEAPIKSGAINTAHHALTINRPLYSIPWSLNYFKGSGCNSLFSEGAKPLVDINQLLIDLKIVPTQIEIDATNNQNKRPVPDKFIKYYNFIDYNSPCLLETILEAFSDEFVGDIISNLSLMELDNYIKLSDKGYYII